jgi:ribonuclease HI
MKAYTDGACRVSNPGQTSCAWVIAITSNEDDVLYFKESGSRYLGPELHTNNYAEYQGLLDLLKYAAKHKIMGLEIYCDSKLVVNQVNDVWDVNNQELVPLWVLAYALRIRGGHTLQHIHGHSGDPGNEYVDRLCNEALDKEGIGK